MKLIVEMEMPRFCAECPMCDNVYYGDDVRKSFCVVFDERKEILTEDRPTWCPIKGELVRCEKCRHGIKAHGISDGWVLCTKPYVTDTVVAIMMHRCDWFCADGERKDGERRTDADRESTRD